MNGFYTPLHKRFKKDFTKYLKSIGCTSIKVGKPNHFDVNGFFTSPQGQPYYFSISDIRGFGYGIVQNLLIRTVRDYEDYSGGSNGYVRLDKYTFESDFERKVR